MSLPGAEHPTRLLERERGVDALERIRRAAARRWACRLKAYHCAAIAMELDAWLDRLGLPGPAASRIRGAVRRTRGVRLSVDECRAIRDMAGS